MTNLERYQSMTAKEFANRFYGALCYGIECCPEDGTCDECVINHLNAEYKEENT